MLGKCNAVEVDTAFAELLSIFSEQYNICCPVKTIRAQVARHYKPWITNGLKNACRKKNRLSTSKPLLMGLMIFLSTLVQT